MITVAELKVRDKQIYKEALYDVEQLILNQHEHGERTAVFHIPGGLQGQELEQLMQIVLDAGFDVTHINERNREVGLINHLHISWMNK